MKDKLLGRAVPSNQKTYPHYFRRVPENETHVDVYWVLQAWNVTSAPVAHAIKKLLCAGNRGHKQRKADLEESLHSLQRAIELEPKE